MSRGAGRIEQAIEAAFAVEGVCYKTDDLCKLVYPDAIIERKHRVSVMRAAKKVCERTDWEIWKVPTKGFPAIFVNRYDFNSYVVGRYFVCFQEWFHYQSSEDVMDVLKGNRLNLTGYNQEHRIAEGSEWLRDFRWIAAKKNDDKQAIAKLEKEYEAAHEARILDILKSSGGFNRAA